MCDWAISVFPPSNKSEKICDIGVHVALCVCIRWMLVVVLQQENLYHSSHIIRSDSAITFTISIHKTN